MKVVISDKYNRIREAIEKQDGWFYTQDIMKELDKEISKSSVTNNLDYLKRAGSLERHHDWRGKCGHYAKWRKTDAWDGD